MKLTYHDACNLGRMSEPWVHWEGKRVQWGILEPNREWRRGTRGVYDQPRNILKAIPGIELEEMLRHHENAWCCGNGGGAKEAFPDFAMWTAGERLREVHATTGAEAIVAACPGCKENFAQSIKTAGDSMKAYDILELVAKAIGK
jgi:Fe-S oxidoreductase